jgi:hypothetical protein
MPLNHVPSQAPSSSNTFPPNPKSEMFLNPPMFEPLNSFPSSAATSQTNELANFVLPPSPNVCHSLIQK